MLKRKSLLERVEHLKDKVDEEEAFINNVFAIMKFFQISYQDVVEMPLPAMNEAVKYIIKYNKEMEDAQKDAKMGKGKMKGLRH